jgi:transposase-like protein
MTLIEFAEKFGTEQQCREHFIAHRMEKGVVCKKCNGTKHYWLIGKQQFQCAACGFRTSLKSGTVLEHSKMPFLFWYTAMYLMTFSKKGISAKELQRQMGHNRYEPLWLMMQKIRTLMGQREDQYKLSDVVEADGAYFITQAPANDSEKSKRTNKIKKSRGRGSERMTPVLVMVESLPGGPDSSRNSASRNPQGRRMRYVRMKQLPGHRAAQVSAIVEKTMTLSQTEIITDNGTEMASLEHIAKHHAKVKSTPQNNDTFLHWVNVVIANAKTTILGIYHRISSKYIQNYLDEFTYRMNRRYFGIHIFERLLGLAAFSG